MVYFNTTAQQLIKQYSPSRARNILTGHSLYMVKNNKDQFQLHKIVYSLMHIATITSLITESTVARLQLNKSKDITDLLSLLTS